MPKSRQKHKRRASPRPRRERPADRCPVCGSTHITWTHVVPAADLGLSSDALRRLHAGEIVRLDHHRE